jgi:hypothetical protein
MRTVVLLPLSIAVLTAASCGEEQYEDADSDTCRNHGSITKVSAEPRYSADYLHRWATSDGCALRLDVLMTRQGEDACGGEEVADILMGSPLGVSTERSKPRIFIRDPKGILATPRTSEAFDPDAQLPPDAEDTGFRQGGVELWMRQANDAFVYLVDEEANVEAWPKWRRWVGCA